MRQDISDINNLSETRQVNTKDRNAPYDDFVLEKSIFSNVFEKDIRRVFIYKKAERLAKAVYLITPAFANSPSLKNRMSSIAIGLVDAAILPPTSSREALSRELLSLSALLSIAKTSGILSVMNAEIISREVHFLLQEVAAYEDPKLLFEDAPTLADLAKNSSKKDFVRTSKIETTEPKHTQSTKINTKGHIKDKSTVSDIHIKDRQESILSIIRNKGNASIKDIATVIRDVSEKTIQRELISLIAAGIVSKQGERRWSTYSLQ